MISTQVAAGARVKELTPTGCSILSICRMAYGPLLMAAGAPIRVPGKPSILSRVVTASSDRKERGWYSGGTESEAWRRERRAFFDALLQARPADVHTQDSEKGETVLHRLLKQGSQQALDVASRDNGRDRYYYSSYSGPRDPAGIFSMVEACVAAGGNLNQASADGATPFLQAVAWMDEERISALLSLGADATVVDSRGRGALHYAVARAQTEVSGYGRDEDEKATKLGALFRTLLAAGADPKQTGLLKLKWCGKFAIERVTPLVAIVALGENILPSEKGYDSPKKWKVVSEVVRALFAVSDLTAQLRDENLLTLCVSWAPIEFVLQLLDGAELNLDQTGTDGDTPLIRALKLPDDGDTKAEKYGAAKSALVELLLARGAGPNVCDDEGHSPLYHAGYQKRMGDVIRKAGGYRSNIET